jgi:hypothetical protein
MSENASEEFASEFSDMQVIVYEGGKWQDYGMLGAMLRPLNMDFGEPFGSRQVIPMHLEEMRCIPVLYPNVKATGFFVGGLNWVVDYIISPIVVVSIKLFPGSKRRMGQLLNWGLKSFSKPPYGTRLKLEATGLDEKGNLVEKSILLSHDSGYDLTAIPVVAAVMQYLSSDRSIRKPGLWRQAEVIEPRRFLLDIQMMGVAIEPPVS